MDSSISIWRTSSVHYVSNVNLRQIQSKLLQNLDHHSSISIVTSGFIDCVEDSSVPLTANELPSFFYETQYDEDNEDLSLFQGFLLVQVCILFSVTAKDI